MTEEEQKPEENLPKDVQPEQTVESSESEKNRLELLPSHIRKELDDLVRTGHGSTLIKKSLEERFLGKTAHLPASADTYARYIKKYKDELVKQVELQKSLIEATTQSLTDVNNAISTTLDDDATLENKRKVFEQLYQRISERIKLLTEAQASGFLNPQMETVLGAYIREQRTIIEKLISFKNDLEKDNTEQVYDEFENLVYAWFVVVINAYKKIHGEDKLNDFKSILKEELPKIIEQYKVNKN